MLAKCKLKQLLNSTELSENQLSFHCAICEVSFNDKSKWLLHARNERHDNTISTLLSNNDCNSENIRQQLLSKSIALLRDKVEFIVHDNRSSVYSFKCIPCDAFINSYFALKEHLRVHESTVKNHTTKNPKVNYKNCEMPPKMADSIPNAGSIIISLQHLTKYFDGELNCHNCGKNLPFNVSSVSSHLNSCILVKSERYLDIKSKFKEFLNSFDSDDDDVLSIIRKHKNLDKLDELSKMTTSLEDIIPKTISCTECNFIGNLAEWKNEVLTHTTDLIFENSVGYFYCICPICNTLVFGVREKIAKHSHFETRTAGQFLLSYPHVKSLLLVEQPLPKYYSFQLKLLRSEGESTDVASYCLACNCYSLMKPENHFQSKTHSSKIHPMFEFYFCRFCNILFYCDEQLYYDHTLSPLHILKQSSKIQYSLKSLGEEHSMMVSNVYTFIKTNPEKYNLKNRMQTFYYWCGSCNYSTNDFLAWNKSHFIHSNHKARVSNVSEFEHPCMVCKICIFGSYDDHVAHSASSDHTKVRNLAFVIYNGRRLQQMKDKAEIEREIIKKDESQKLSTENNKLNLNSLPLVTNVQKIKKKEELETNVTGSGPFILKMKMDCECEIEIRDFILTLADMHGAVDNVKGFCLFCQRYFSIKSWLTHLQSSDHLDVIAPLKSRMRFYTVFCYSCKSINFGPKSVLALHVNSKIHKETISKMDTVNVVPINRNSSTEEDEKELGEDSVNCRFSVPDTVEPEIDSRAEENGREEEKERDTSEKDLAMAEDALYDMLKNDSNADREKEKLKNDGEKPDNIEYAIVVRGIPERIIHNWSLMKQVFQKYITFDRSFTRRNEPESLYLVISKEPEESFRKIKQHLNDVKLRLGIDELFVDFNATKNEGCGIKDKLSHQAVSLFSNILRLESKVRELIRTYDSERNNPESHRRINQLRDVVRDFARYIYNKPEMKAHIFGSRITGLASKNSDVDIYLQIGPTFRGLVHRSVELQQQLVILFAKQMSYYPREFGNIVSIPFARVPIVKFMYRSLKLNCDLSFKSGLSTMNSMLVRTYLELDHRITWLICALKIWMRLNDLADRNLFTTYAQIWMILFFLMQPDIAVVPTVLSLKLTLPVHQQTFTVEDWNCAFPNIKNIMWRSKCTLSVEELLKQFFVFYSNEALNNYVLCTFTGLKIEKKHFLKFYEGLPNIFETYKSKVISDRLLLTKVINDFDGLCLQDPFDHCHNLTKTVNTRKFLAFVELCKQTVQLLED